MKTGYEELDKRIALTREKKDKLLLVSDLITKKALDKSEIY